MTEHIEDGRIHDLVEGLLSPSERETVEAHVAGCPECRETAAALTALRAAMEALPGRATPPEGLWRAIEERMGGMAPEGPTRERDVLPLAAALPRRRLAFSIPQLAAAAVVVSLLSAGAVWVAMGGSGASRTMAEMAAPLGGAARAVSSGEASYESAVAELEQVLEEGRDLLAPETVAAVERSLATIDQAIAEVREAMRGDPSSELLARLLVKHQGSRLRVLRQAATLARPQI